jgi:transketolase
MRRIFGKTMVELAEKDSKVVLLCGDIGFAIFDEYRGRYPNQFVNVGIREQAMIGIAAGMALEGMKPYVYTITPFLIERPFEQVKLDIDNQYANVKLIGYADYPEDGPTHSEIDARWLMSNFKNIVSYFPKNSDEVREILLKSQYSYGPIFASLKKDESVK